MQSTSASLLQRLRQPQAHEAWERFVQLYTPLLYHWACRLGMQNDDAADLVQDVLTLLIEKLPEFEYDRSKSFRAWLKTVTMNRWRNQQRRRPMPTNDDADQLAAPSDLDHTEAFAEEEYRQYVIGQALRILQAEFQPSTWKVFQEHMVQGKPAAEVAAQLGTSLDAVYAVKSRVLRRLRQELDGLMD